MNAPAYQDLILSMGHAKVSLEVSRLTVHVNNCNKHVLILSGETEAPPTLQQSTPPNVEANRLKVLITGFVPSTVRESDLLDMWCIAH